MSSTPTKIISISNPKGGVGKTTTAINLAASIALAEKKVLLIDLDPNGALTEGMGFRREEVHTGVFDLFLGTFDCVAITYKCNVPFLDLIPCNIFNNEQEIRLNFMAKNRILLKTKINDLILRSSVHYDYIIIDTPPSLNDLTMGALYAANSVLIPLQCGYFALQVVDRLLRLIERIRKGANPDLTIEGVVLNFYEKSTRAGLLSAAEAEKMFKHLMAKTVIPKNAAISYAAFEKLPIVLVDACSPGAVSYLELAREILDNNQNLPSGILNTNPYRAAVPFDSDS
jgi:chromosome partitioning protein